MNARPANTVLDKFSSATRAWFTDTFHTPTEAQKEAWDAISRGSHTLVISPTGSGKTLAAFLWAIDTLLTTPPEILPDTKNVGSHPGAPQRATRVLYISPLKALAVDVERNLNAPLAGITLFAQKLGASPVTVRTGVRSGDTPPSDRRSLVKTPPDILITTPESLFLMLTSAARETLRNIETIIVDEVHAVAGTKRGAHLAVSLERLDTLTHKPAQRIGLSATVRPHDTVARFLGGTAPVHIVNPASTKKFDLHVVVPVEKMGELSAQQPREKPANLQGETGSPPTGSAQTGSIWPHVEEAIVEQVLRNRTAIVFANSRRLAERLTARFNEIYEQKREATAQNDRTAHNAHPAPNIDAANATTQSAKTNNTAANSSTSVRTRRPHAEMMGQSGQTFGAEPVFAQAHHGSVSKERRALIENDLKSGRLRCVVATSSLELGIDMGFVDVVIQVESPPSVASGLQRIGRAGHGVGESSYGIIFPKHRADLVHSTVTAERMLSGEIEALAIPANPLDILAQQTIAAAALDTLNVDEWFDTIRRSAPFAQLPRSAYDATMDLLAGRYPSDEFGELRPRIVWDRDAGTLTGRPGSQRLAVTSGGTIPDRGLFGVFMVGDKPARVGELDEEMVYESRVGDVFALGATSWRIQEITHDRVLVTPAYGEPGRLPFWKGDLNGRPAELGRAIGTFVREVSQMPENDARERCAKQGLDENAITNLLSFLEEQRMATGQLPSDHMLVVERFRDELGDWRIVMHSPFGMQVHAPWGLAVNARVRERFGIDGGCVASDDGIVARFPHTEVNPPGVELFLFEPDELEQLVTREIGGSALFASRFRECAARALLLPRYNPGKRSPLWQQRQRAAQLLDIARTYPTFPIVLETVRECLQDVYDLPALAQITQEIENRQIQIVETTTSSASPFARTLLFGYVAEFMYEGDTPLAERRSAALTLDPDLLRDLLGHTELRELLDPKIIIDTENELQRLHPERKARKLEEVADLLRTLGPLTEKEISERTHFTDPPLLNSETSSTAPSDPHDMPHNLSHVTHVLRDLEKHKRAIRVMFHGQEWWAAIEDASRLRDAFGISLPEHIPDAFHEPVVDPVGDLVSRFARTHGPFTTEAVAERLHLGPAIVQEVLTRLTHNGRVISGAFTPHGSQKEWCDPEVLRRLRRRSLAAFRQEQKPVDPETFARFLPEWHHIGSQLRGVDAVASVVEQLDGARIPASAWETLIFPARVNDYSPFMLDELTSSGEILWSGVGSLPGNDGWMSFHLADTAPLTLPLPEPVSSSTVNIPAEGNDFSRILDILDKGGGFFFRQLSDALGSMNDTQLSHDLWELVWSGHITNDTFAPVRALLESGKTAPPSGRHIPQRARIRPQPFLTKPRLPSRAGQPVTAGRWSRLPHIDDNHTRRAHAAAETLLGRYGIITRGSVTSERVPGGFALAYRVLSQFEETGRVRRGYYIDGLGAAQFALSSTVDRLRSYSRPSNNSPSSPSDPALLSTFDSHSTLAVVLAATDPANPYGAALSWPETLNGQRPARKAGALVILVDGKLGAYLTRGAKTALTFTENSHVLDRASHALVDLVYSGRIGPVTIEKVNGTFVLNTPFGSHLSNAGFRATPRGLRAYPA